MILKQIIRYTNADAIEATWVDENDVAVKCHAYSNHPEQMAMLRADLGADAAAHEALIAEIEATYVPPEPEPPYVPTSVTMRQARLALLGAGLLASIDAAIGSLPSPQKEAARIEWEYATEVQRSSGLVPMMKVALGLDDAALDALFIEAAAL